MSVWRIAWRNITQRGLASTLTVLSMAFGYAVMIVVLILHSVVTDQFSKDGQGYEMVIGAKGGSLQLLFNSVFHLDKPIENIPYAMYEECLTGRFADFVEVAVPMCLGDSYRREGSDLRYRVVGTQAEMFSKLAYDRNDAGEDIGYTFAEGRNLKNENFFEAVIGSTVARQTGLEVGERIMPTHGITDGDLHEEQSFEIVGILDRTDTSNDRAVFINMEGFYLLENHSLDEQGAARQQKLMESERAAAKLGGGAASEATPLKQIERPVPKDAKTGQSGIPWHLREVTAILVKTRNPIYNGYMHAEINAGLLAQAIFQTQEIQQFLDTIIRPMQTVLLILTLLIVLVTSLNIAVGIYNSMQQRRRDIAIMRALGASRLRVLSIVLCEASLLSVLAGVVGYFFGHGLIAASASSIETWAGVRLMPFRPAWFEFSLPGAGSYRLDFADLLGIPALAVLAAIVGLFPAITAYRTEVSDGLAQH